MERPHADPSVPLVVGIGVGRSSGDARISCFNSVHQMCKITGEPAAGEPH